MALFDENVTVEPPAPRSSRRVRVGLALLAVALVAVFVLSLLPTSYVIQQPGPVYDTLGSATTSDGQDIPLIEVDGHETYPTAGTLDLLTVQVVGNRERTPSWIELAGAWFDPTRAVVPLDAVFPAGETTEERDAANTAMMVDSQKEATAAALTELGYDVTTMFSVGQLAEGSPAEGVLEVGDAIATVNGVAPVEARDITAAVLDSDGAPVEFGIVRDGASQTVAISPVQVDTAEGAVWRVGVVIAIDFQFPFQVTIQLDNVGGPSAGMMFALGIIDTLTPGELNGGREVAGTGTIDAKGEVGAIGGIRQKLWGAKDAGADIFLAPSTNCDEVVGHVPDGLQVFSVATLDDSLAVLEAVRDGGDLAALPTCAAG